MLMHYLGTIAHDLSGNYPPWRAFANGAYGWYPTNSTAWVAYEFSSPISANSTSFKFKGNYPANDTVLVQSSPDGTNWITLGSTNIVIGGGGYSPYPTYYIYFTQTSAQYWRWYFYGDNVYESIANLVQLYNQQSSVISSSNVLQIASLTGVSINTPTAAGYGLNVVGGLGADSITATTATIQTNNSQYIPNTATADISDSGNGDFKSLSIAGTPINFTTLTNNSILEYYVTNCFDIATNYNGFYTHSTNSGFSQYWTNNATGWVMIIGSVGGSTSYFVTNGAGAFSTIPIFIRPGGNVLGQWPYNPSESNPGYGYAYYQPGDMPYVTDVITNLPQTFTGTFNGGFNSTLPHIPASVSVGGSAFSFTNMNATALECYVTDAAAYSVSKNGVSIYGSLAGDTYVLLQPSSYLTITYLSTAPTMTTNAW